ncbi:MAG: 4'-phosphopantetheinyl transferase superfamily protein [Chitinophagaceae bacterium]|nr:4'-phosphopantetheinyl transferase superfamily protein [Chitinophagaceae bacterium]
MSTRIYSTEYKTPLPHKILDALLANLPPDVAAKARRYRLWQDTYGCVFGKLLLIHALQEQGHTTDLRTILYTDYGRPYLPDTPDFNISHSAHRVVCAITDTGRIGIDLEEIRGLNIEDFKDQFTPEEWQTITHAPAPLHAFYHFWTAKECLSKADGRGLNLPLASLAITPDKTIRLHDRPWQLHTITSFSGYACHIATENPADELFIEDIPLNELSISVLENHRNYPT